MKVSSIARNTSFFTLALVIQKIITFTYFTILARNLAPEDLGKFYLAISLSSIFLIIIDIGQANVLTREISRLKEGDRQGANDIIGQVMAFKLPLAVLAIISLIILANLLNYPEITRQLIYISALVMALDAFSTSFFSIVRAFHNLKFESFSSVATQLIILLTGIAALKLGLGIIFLMLVMLLGSFFRFGFSFYLIKFKWRLSLRPKYDPARLKSLFFLTVPFALYGLFNKLYLYLDTVLLSKLAGDYYVGLYQIAFKIIFALQFLPMAFIASLYPAFSKYWTACPDPKDKQKLAKEDAKNQGRGPGSADPQLQITFERAFNYLTFISLPVSAGIIAVSDKIILLFTEKYLEALPVLNTIMLGAFFVFVNFVLGALLNACDLQKQNTRNIFLVLLLSIGLNFLLIPGYQAQGAAVTAAITNAAMFALSLYYCSKIVKLRFLKIGLPFAKALASAFAMAAFAYYYKESYSLLFVVPASAFIYASLLVISRAVYLEDIRSIALSFYKNNGKQS